jgi:hypothetical protein
VRWAAALLGITAVIVVLGSVWIGAPQTWELLTAIASPATEDYPVLAWSISILGYLLVPALIGLAVSVVAEIEVQRRLAPLQDRLESLSGSLNLTPPNQNPPGQNPDPGGSPDAGPDTPPGSAPPPGQ